MNAKKMLVCLLLVPGCVWKLMVAAEIHCKSSAATYVKNGHGVDAQCTAPPGPLYDCTSRVNAAGNVEWDCKLADATRQAKATRKEAFKEEEFAQYKTPGTGSIAGQAFLKTRGGDVKYGAGNDVALVPVTAYTTEIFNITIKTGQLFDSEADSRLESYVRKTTADGEGRFKFQNLPAGSYYAYTYVSWEIPSKSGLEKTGGWVGAKIDVADTNVDSILKSFE